VNWVCSEEEASDRGEAGAKACYGVAHPGEEQRTAQVQNHVQGVKRQRLKSPDQMIGSATTRPHCLHHLADTL